MGPTARIPKRLDVPYLQRRIRFQLSGGLLPPFSCAYVKGFKRGLMLLCCLQAIRELGLEHVVEHWVKAPCLRRSEFSASGELRDCVVQFHPVP